MIGVSCAFSAQLPREWCPYLNRIKGSARLTFLITGMAPCSLGWVVSARFLLCKITVFLVVVNKCLGEDSLKFCKSYFTADSPVNVSIHHDLLGNASYGGVCLKMIFSSFLPHSLELSGILLKEGLSFFPTCIYLIYISMDLQIPVLFRGVTFSIFIILWLLLFQFGALRSFFRLTPVFLLPTSSLSLSRMQLSKSPLNIDLVLHL